VNSLFKWLRRQPKLGIVRVTEEEFDSVIADYARACTLGDYAGMRKNYVVLKWMCLRVYDQQSMETEPGVNSQF
jgi:hypothetical protein